MIRSVSLVCRRTIQACKIQTILPIVNGQMGIIHFFSYESIFPTLTQLPTNIYYVNSLYVFTH